MSSNYYPYHTTTTDYDYITPPAPRQETPKLGYYPVYPEYPEHSEYPTPKTPKTPRTPKKSKLPSSAPNTQNPNQVSTKR